MTVNGDFQGTDTIHVDGTIQGNISVTNTLVIGKSGMVEGNIEAKHVIINGELNGTIKCENLEVMQTGKVSNKIEAKHLILDGIVDGDITAEESIEVLINSKVNATKLKSKTITVNGLVKGTLIATELLEIQSDGFVEGTITVKNIKTDEGGRVIGTMSTYAEPLQNNIKKKEKSEPMPLKNASAKQGFEKQEAIKKNDKDDEDNFFS
jgi:cytoskeletal protein CcmA (bactofilin family)